ncbi:DsbA family protein [Frondihabitans cladoniiphilus]|uniref:Thioredoxin-like fold domain-containing protein n=1 Tax=Frondihabitans cladoniiphilus TaxID=715785 RepID=A0ABP8VRV2_9MICO
MTPPPDNGPNKRDRREEAREKARLAREAAARKKRRNTVFARSGIIVGVLAILVIVALVIISSVKPAGPGPANMASDGILLKGDATTSQISAVKTAAIKSGGTPTATDDKKLTGTVNITVYLDYQCPYCDQFETANASQIKTWLQKGAVTYEIHPISILDGSSLGTRYSSRSANAAACVANYDPNDFLAVTTAFYANQPAEGTSGLTNAKILSLLKGAGASSSDITSCVNNETFKSWVTASTKRALSDKLPNSSVAKVTGTPTVIVNGKLYSGSLTDASAFSSFVASTATS